MYLTRPSRWRSHEHVPMNTHTRKHTVQLLSQSSAVKTTFNAVKKDTDITASEFRCPSIVFSLSAIFPEHTTHCHINVRSIWPALCSTVLKSEMKTNYGLCPVPLIWSPNTKEFHKRGANLLILPNLFATHANMILFKKKTPNNRLFYSFILQI